MKELAPIALFVYKRPWHTLQTVEALQKNELVEDSELFIFSDGPKSENDKKDVQAVRAYLKTITGFKSVTIIERERNLGLSQSIISGVTEIVNKYSRIIVIEDDMVTSPYFLKFMNDALEFYKDVPKVMHVSGYMFPVEGNLPETFFYRAASCWGWATWKRAWEKFEPDVKKLLARFQNAKQRSEFDIQGTMNFFKMLQLQDKGKIDSWAIRWYASVFLNDGLCLHPGVSLVNNIGHDATGVHCSTTDTFKVRLNKNRIFDFIQDIRENEKAVKLMESFYQSLKKPLPIRIINKFKEIIKIK